jgi:ubiquinone/menaquinone biosynthesis C-methylase UbiE
MNLRKYFAAQLGHPSGIFSSFAAILWNKRNLALNETAFEILCLQANDHVLEIGFGGGYLLGQMLNTIEGGMLCGIDISSEMVKRCERQYSEAITLGKIEFKCAIAEEIPYPSKNFTKVCSVNSIFYWQDIDEAFCEIARVLGDNGQFVLCFTVKESLITKSFADQIQLYEVEEIRDKLFDSGFQEIKVKTTSDQHRKYACVSSRKV